MVGYAGLSDLRSPLEKQVIYLIDRPKTSIGVGNLTVQLGEMEEILKNCMAWKVAATNEIKA